MVVVTRVQTGTFYVEAETDQEAYAIATVEMAAQERDEAVEAGFGWEEIETRIEVQL